MDERSKGEAFLTGNLGDENRWEQPTALEWVISNLP